MQPLTLSKLKLLQQQQLQENDDDSLSTQAILKLQYDSENPYSYSLACLLGALIGDALGATILYITDPSDEQVENALTMPGGGPLNLLPGQSTDAGELMLGQTIALVDGNGELCLDEIAKQYGFWANSSPCEIGITTRNAFRPLLVAKVRNWDAMNPRGLARLCMSAAKGANQYSESNGGLMRIAPLAIWGSLLSDSDFYKAVGAELSLTHPNETSLEAAFTYCMAIRHLLSNLGDMKGAYEKVKAYIMKKKGSRLISWLEGIEEEDLPVANKNIGWARIAWSYSMYFLKIELKDFTQAMKRILKLGGDTSKNASIVGAIIGAAIGMEEMPEDWVQKLKEVDVSRLELKNRRDIRYNPETVWELMPKLYKIRPTKLRMV